MTNEDSGILARFDYAPGKSGNTEPVELTAIREAVRATASTLLDQTTGGREQALAITHLEQAYMWAVAAYCRNKAKT